MDMSEIVSDPDFCESFTVCRTTGDFGEGGWIPTISTIANPNPELIPTSGVVIVASDKELRSLPEGDRIKGAMIFFSTIPLYVTNETENNISDKLLWNGEYYKIISIADWSSYGFYKATGVRIAGN